MKAPASQSSSLADFWDDGPSSSTERKDNYSSKSSSSSSANVPDLLNWISNVTIKRRKFRRRTRCSNLLAEAVLSSTLRQARQELALKQEEKRKKAQEFSYQLSIIKYSPQEFESSSNASQNDNNYNNNNNNYYFDQNDSQQNQTSNLSDNETKNNNNNCRKDEYVQACITSLDDFFSELKSIKV